MAAVAGDSTGAGDDGGRDRDGDGDAQPVPSGLLTHLPGGRTEAAVLAAALRQLSTLARALSRNVRLLNGGLERTLQDKKDIEELEGILNRFVEGQARELKSLVARH